MKRATVFEMISGRMIQDILNHRMEAFYQKHTTLGASISKGIALGYIKEDEYRRWIYDEEI